MVYTRNGLEVVGRTFFPRARGFAVISASCSVIGRECSRRLARLIRTIHRRHIYLT